MSLSHELRSWVEMRRGAAAGCVALAAAVSACGPSARPASSPHAKTKTTAARLAPRVERIVVAESGTISMVSRDGCLATVTSGEAGARDELRIRCPKANRLDAWFGGVERVLGTVALEPDEESDDDAPLALPAAKVLTVTGKTFHLGDVAGVARLAGEVRALEAELAGAEAVTPGPTSPSGWQMLHVAGPAHVLFAGTPVRGAFEARLSTNGQYLCEFVTDAGDGPMLATKSGWLKPATASRAIDEVLAPFNAVGPEESAGATYAAGTKDGNERRSNPASTAEVFSRFSEVQDALGDACLPELEPPSADIGL